MPHKMDHAAKFLKFALEDSSNNVVIVGALKCNIDTAGHINSHDTL